MDTKKFNPDGSIREISQPDSAEIRSLSPEGESNSVKTNLEEPKEVQSRGEILQPIDSLTIPDPSAVLEALPQNSTTETNPEEVMERALIHESANSTSSAHDILKEITGVE